MSSNVPENEMNRIMSIALRDIPSDQIRHLSNINETFQLCPQNLVGFSQCFGGIQWNSIDIENKIYNYTIRGNSGLSAVDVTTSKGSTDKYVLPLQWAIDSAIANFSSPSSNIRTPYSIPFTSISSEDNTKKRDQSYLDTLKDWLVPTLYIALIGCVYHLAGFIADEREAGITNLLFSMGAKNTSRLLGYVSVFSLVYGISWIACGAIYKGIYFSHTNAAIPILFNIFSGFATVSWSIMFGVMFKTAQFAGIASSTFSMLLAFTCTIQSQVGDGANSPGIIYILSFLFSPMSYCFFWQVMSLSERDYIPLNLFQQVNGGKVIPFVIFITPIFHFFAYLLIAYFIEPLFHGPLTTPKKVADSGYTVQLSSIDKQYPPRFQFGARKKKNTVHAVKNLSLNVSSNQIYSLLGANGSGKTTTLEMIAGIQRPSSGEIFYGSHVKIGICPQKNVLWDDLTVEEHIKVWSLLKGVPLKQTKQITDVFIRRCGLIGKGKTYSKNLSGGQKRKLQLAIMFTGGSNLCCIDEVSSGVDPVSRRLIWDILLDFRSNHTMILTTHFLDEADLLSDHIAILSKGDLQAEGVPMELKETYGNGYRVFVDHPGTGHEEVHQLPDARSVLQMIPELEERNEKFEITGPTLEDAFLKLASKDHAGYTLENYKVNRKNAGAAGDDADLEMGNLLTGMFSFFFS